MREKKLSIPSALTPHEITLWREGCLSWIVNNMATDDLATQGARASAVMILMQFTQNIPASASESLNHPINISLHYVIKMKWLIYFGHSRNLYWNKTSFEIDHNGDFYGDKRSSFYCFRGPCQWLFSTCSSNLIENLFIHIFILDLQLSLLIT